MPDQSYQGKLNMFPYDPRFTAIAPPSKGIFEEPTMSICFNVEWAGHIDGVLSRLLWTDAWAGDKLTKEWAVSNITRLLVSMIARTPCGEGGDCMDCCDDIIARLDAIEALLAGTTGNSPASVKAGVDGVLQSYQDYLEDTDAIYDNDITNVHPDWAYGDADDPKRDAALCFMTRRFVDIICDWVIANINMKVANQQTVLNIARLIGDGAGLLGRIFAETAFGQMFDNIDLMLELETAALSTWIASISADQLSIFQDTSARASVACAWYEQLAGATPTEATFVSSLTSLLLSGNAEIIRDKIAAALVPVAAATDPDPEHVFFIFSDLWQQAYDGVNAGIVTEDCGCDGCGPAWDEISWYEGIVTSSTETDWTVQSQMDKHGAANQVIRNVEYGDWTHGVYTITGFSAAPGTTVAQVYVESNTGIPAGFSTIAEANAACPMCVRFVQIYRPMAAGAFTVNFGIDN